MPSIALADQFSETFVMFFFYSILHLGNFSFPYFMDLFFWEESLSYLMISSSF